MTKSSPHMVTEILRSYCDGNRAALDDLIPIIYEELRRLAKGYMGRERRHRRMGYERRDISLQTSALINEAYIRLVEQQVSWQNRAQFVGIAARLMRQILVDNARMHNYAKRGGNQAPITLDQVADLAASGSKEIIALNDALISLEKLDPRQSQIVELRFFGGLTIEEAASTLGISHATLEREWRTARAWLQRELNRQE